MTIRAALASDSDAVWAVLEPVIRAGETYALPREMSRRDVLAFWFAPRHEVFLAEDSGQAVGTSFARSGPPTKGPCGSGRASAAFRKPFCTRPSHM
jgi:hypothetical protein